MQVVSAVSAMQSGPASEKPTPIRASVVGTRPCQERKDGAPTFQNGKTKKNKKGWATRQRPVPTGNALQAQPAFLNI